MKSFEKQLAESCPAIFDFHKDSWEQFFAPKSELPPAALEPEEIIEEHVETPIVQETITGKRVINPSLIKKMTAGY